MTPEIYEAVPTNPRDELRERLRLKLAAADPEDAADVVMGMLGGVADDWDTVDVSTYGRPNDVITNRYLTAQLRMPVPGDVNRSIE